MRVVDLDLDPVMEINHEYEKRALREGGKWLIYDLQGEMGGRESIQSSFWTISFVNEKHREYRKRRTDER